MACCIIMKPKMNSTTDLSQKPIKGKIFISMENKQYNR